MKTKNRNIGGSILPSSDTCILTPIKFKGGELAVVPDNEKDTHHLVLTIQHTLASHPNGYCCHSLGQRIIKGQEKPIREQIKWIINCAGTALSFEEITQITTLHRKNL